MVSSKRVTKATLIEANTQLALELEQANCALDALKNNESELIRELGKSNTAARTLRDKVNTQRENLLELTEKVEFLTVDNNGIKQELESTVTLKENYKEDAYRLEAMLQERDTTSYHLDNLSYHLDNLIVQQHNAIKSLEKQLDEAFIPESTFVAFFKRVLGF